MSRSLWLTPSASERDCVRRVAHAVHLTHEVDTTRQIASTWLGNLVLATCAERYEQQIWLAEMHVVLVHDNDLPGAPVSLRRKLLATKAHRLFQPQYRADAAADWLAAGMSLSAVLLTATAAGLVPPRSAIVTEKAVTRQHLRQTVPSGYPQVAVRIGRPQPDQPPITPRRPADEVITVASPGPFPARDRFRRRKG